MLLHTLMLNVSLASCLQEQMCRLQAQSYCLPGAQLTEQHLLLKTPEKKWVNQT